MKKLNKLICLGLMITAAGNAAAYNAKQCAMAPQWNFGFDFMHMRVSPNADYAKIFRKSFLGMNLHLGARWWKYFGAEVGYYWTNDNSKGFELANGASAFGVTNNASTISEGDLRFKNIFFDMHFFYPLTSKIDALAIAGLGTSRQSITIITNQDSNIKTVLDSITGKTNYIGRLGVGLQYMFTRTTGIRITERFENFDKLRLRGTNLYTAKAFGNGFSTTVGLFWNFDAY